MKKKTVEGIVFKDSVVPYIKRRTIGHIEDVKFGDNKISLELVEGLEVEPEVWEFRFHLHFKDFSRRAIARHLVSGYECDVMPEAVKFINRKLGGMKNDN